MKKELLKIFTGITFLCLWTSSALAIECIEGALPQDLEDLLSAIKNALVAAGIIIAAIFIVLGGYNFITAGGAAEKVETARKQVLYALIGVGVILVAEAIVGIVKAILCGE
jgi:hypothetical protein